MVDTSNDDMISAQVIGGTIKPISVWDEQFLNASNGVSRRATHAGTDGSGTQSDRTCSISGHRVSSRSRTHQTQPIPSISLATLRSLRTFAYASVELSADSN